MSSSDRAAELLTALGSDDGGFAPAPGGESEPEPTALAALALGAPSAMRWLSEHQQPDGSFVVGPLGVRNDAATPLAALALSADARRRALDYVVAHRAQRIELDPRFPHDPGTRGWGWTPQTFGWVEPTARAVLALKVARPDAEEISDGVAVLVDRECTAGGWNYGNPEVLGRRLEPFLQTTAAGLMALQDGPAAVRDRAIALIEELWPSEPGGLGWAMAAVALRLAGADASAVAEELDSLVRETHLMNDAVALGWAVLGLGDGWRHLKAAPR